MTSWPICRVRSGGEGRPTVLLLHGLGATGEVWNGLIDLLDAAPRSEV